MKILSRLSFLLLILEVTSGNSAALERTNVVFPIFQFPADRIPRADGDASDWSIVPESYVMGTDQLVDDTGRHKQPDAANLAVRVTVGWVKGLNRLYFLYEADDDYWDFALPGLRNDTFELVVDADLSGGPLIEKFHPAREVIGAAEAYSSFQSVHAQNYHIFTPAEGKSWCMFWGPAQWLKELPYANVAYDYKFKPGEHGHLVMEFWITPFDYARAEGPQRAVESVLVENKLIGLAWAVIDYDRVGDGKGSNGFWNLSRKHTMYGSANDLCLFKLMPLEIKYQRQIEASWSFKVVDHERRLVAFKDSSIGVIAKWDWDFGDGSTSQEQNPLHVYTHGGQYVVVLWVEGPAGRSRMAKVWDVTLK